MEAKNGFATSDRGERGTPLFDCSRSGANQVGITDAWGSLTFWIGITRHHPRNLHCCLMENLRIANRQRQRITMEHLGRAPVT